MSAQRSSGVQTLLEAERKAQMVVQQARTYRTQRLKAAKADASKEVEEYRKKKEHELEEYQQKHTGNTSKAEQDARKWVEQELASLAEKASKAQSNVISKLAQSVTTPVPAKHINA